MAHEAFACQFFLAEFIDWREGSGEGTHVCYRGKSGQILNLIRDSSQQTHSVEKEAVQRK